MTISLCMIVKDEAAILARCLDSVADLMDEIIIVDTGSTDNTKEVAARYTDKIYDYAWHDDFAAARNFSFSHATMDYIYAPDADEVLDDENRERFAYMKETLEDNVDIVQMLYHTVSDFNTVLNAKKEYRPKLFKRLRTFQWIDPIHETVETAPVIYDSDIVILHMPQHFHHKRDFSIFLKAFYRDGSISPRIFRMYAKELLKLGEDKDFEEAYPVFSSVYRSTTDPDLRKDAACILAHLYRLQGSVDDFFSLALKDMVTTACSEMCYELGQYYESKDNYDEAIIWYYNAASEAPSILDIRTSGILPLRALQRCYQALMDFTKKNDPDSIVLIDYLQEQIDAYAKMADEWQMPEAYQ